MKKSDLTRRALLATRKMRSEDSAALGFEAGYREARADLRRVIEVKRPFRGGEYWTLSRIRQWLRPIR